MSSMGNHMQQYSLFSHEEEELFFLHATIFFILSRRTRAIFPSCNNILYSLMEKKSYSSFTPARHEPEKNKVRVVSDFVFKD
jgi:hypothetical protein